MPYRKKIVCLANSKKHRGKCFAGKEVLEEGYGGWIRPVSCRKGEEISCGEQTFADGSYPQLLDVVSIPMLEPKPMHHQQENHLIDKGQRWRIIKSMDHNVLSELRDDIPGDLWINGSSSNPGCNDRVLFADAKNLEESLFLIAPTSLKFIVRWKERRKGIRQVRADFHHNKNHYNLVVTDPVIEQQYMDMSYSDYRKDGQGLPREYSATVDGVYLCISLGEKLYRYCYKLVAAVHRRP